MPELKKIKKIAPLKIIIRRLKQQGKSVVFTNGCFDLLHIGHVRYLAKAKQKGDILVVGLNSDSSVRRLKGRLRPLVCQHDRAGILAGLASVDYVVIFNQATPFKIIKALQPDVLVKGADWPKLAIVGAEFVRGYGAKVATIPLVAGRSTTKLIKKIARRY